MELSVDKMFLILGIISFPNLFFRGQYNVPLLIFCFACWQNSNKNIIIYLLIISWFFDVYLLFDYIAKSDQQKYYQTGQKGQVVLVVSIIVFVSKLLLIIYLIIFDQNCQNSLRLRNIVQSFKNLGKFSTHTDQQKQKQIKAQN